MIVIPAIDLHEGSVVRLKKGVFEEVTYYSKDPAEVAVSFADAGAKRIHVVDLDGSIKGAGVNTKAIEAICRASTLPVELGGGIRSMADAKRVSDLGVTYVILGTMVVKDKEAAKEIIRAFPGRVAIGIDALKGKVAIHGWKEVTDTTAVMLAKEYEEVGPAFVVYTDIDRDGMLTGVNIEETRVMAEQLDTPVVASGGVSSIDDLAALTDIPRLMGAITGKAVYEGKLDLKQAIARIES